MCLLKRSYRLRSSALRYTKSPSELSSGKWAQADDHLSAAKVYDNLVYALSINRLG